MSIIDHKTVQQIGYQICPAGIMNSQQRENFSNIINNITEKELKCIKIKESNKQLQILHELISDEYDIERKDYYFDKIKEILE